MDLSHIDLTSHLVSPKSGMDLAKGVPAKVDRGDSQDRSSKTRDDFDHVLRNSHSREDESKKPSKLEGQSDSKPVKDDKSVVRKTKVMAKNTKTLAIEEQEDVAPSQSAQIETISSTQDESEKLAQFPPLDVVSEMSDEDKECNTDVLLESLPTSQNLAQRIPVEEIALVPEALKAVTGEEELEPLDGDVLNLPPEVINPKSEGRILPTGLEFKGAEHFEEMNQNQNIEKSIINADELKAKNEKSGVVADLVLADRESVKAMSLDNSDMQNAGRDLLNDESDVPEQMSNLREGQISETPARDFKSMVDSLWIEQNLKTAQPLESLQLVKPGEFESKGVEHTARTNLVEDMKPLITQAVYFKKGGEMTISLKPQDLGWVKVEVKVESDGVKVAIQAEQSSARDLLKGQTHELKDQLKAAGMNLQEVSVGPMKDSSPHGNRNPDSQEQRRQPQQDSQPKFREEQRDFSEFQAKDIEGSKAA